MQAPNKCPMCGAQDEWHLIDTAKKGFNAKHAVIGGLLLNGVGLAAGFSGKRKSLYQCGKCGFSHEYDGIADKDAKNVSFSAWKQQQNMQKKMVLIFLQQLFQ